MSQLLAVKVRRKSGQVERSEFSEAGGVTAVQYDQTEIVTEHGLHLLTHDLGMEKALELLTVNADNWGWPTVIETPAVLFQDTDCAGLIVRPSFWTFGDCLWWVQEQGYKLICHFGHGARFVFLPELYGLDEVQID